MKNNFERLTKKNIILYAQVYYDNPFCIDIQEFYTDLKKIKYIRKLLKKYIEKGKLSERLVLNHLICFYNVFEPNAATRMLFYKIEQPYHSALKTFLIYLNRMPDRINGLDSENLNTNLIPLDNTIVEVLRTITNKSKEVNNG
tara:strand:+ start:5816 stop:6244 length:429 start_codon:yes stop_codon:yes gene_type:complete